VRHGDPLGPLHGVPVSLKDLEPTAGLRTTYGSRFFADNVPDADGISAERLRAAGAIIFGKTNTPAYGHKDMCDNLLMPPTANPWALDRTSGASSGGAGAAVAAGFGPLAHGTDGAGSIRIPAALCGVFGFKPSFGRIPFWPNRDFWGHRTHPGPLARTVRDAALMLGVLAGPDPRDPLAIDASPEDYVAACDGDLRGRRVAWSGDFGYALVADEVRRITEAAAYRFGELGCHVEAVTPTWENPYEWHATLYRAGIAARFGDQLAERPEWVDPSLAGIIAMGQQITTRELLDAQMARGAFYDASRRFLEPYDLLLTPAMPCGAWPLNQSAPTINGQPLNIVPGGRWPFMFPFNATGWPASSVPCGFTAEGLPVGLQIVAPWHQDAFCLRASAAFEEMQPWAHRRPPL